MDAINIPFEGSFLASPERSSPEEILKENNLFASEKSFIDILSAISGIVLVINENRQIVYVNQELLKALSLMSPEQVLGKRPGEALGCIHANEMPGGCGTSEACTVCGAVEAILKSQTGSEKVTTESRITTQSGDFQVSWDMMVTSSPVKVADQSFYVMSLNDISHEKRRQSLEKIFFHDVLNIAGSLNGLISILKGYASEGEPKKVADMTEAASKELIEEILQHKQLKSAENGDLVVNFDLEKASDMLKLAAGKIEHHPVGEGKTLVTEDHSGGVIMETDRVLLQRVLINMYKNALEATRPGGSVVAVVGAANDKIIFMVKNEQVMPKNIQMQIFQRSFSTKGKGRGTGTYSIKLLTETYLRGKAGFRSNEMEGTVFYIELPVRIPR